MGTSLPTATLIPSIRKKPGSKPKLISATFKPFLKIRYRMHNTSHSVRVNNKMQSIKAIETVKLDKVIL
jgi:hypothetical protein